MEWYRSQLRRDAAGLLACPDELPGLDSVTLSEGNAELASQKRMGNYDVASDGSVDSRNTVPSPGFVNPNGPPVSPPFVPNFDMLWVANLTVSQQIFGFAKSQATNDGEFGAPAITLTLPAIGIGATSTPGTLCFASNGDMWVGYQSGTDPGGGQTLARFSAVKLLASGAITADTVIQLPAIDATYSGVASLCADSKGGLWVAAVSPIVATNHVLYFSATQLSVSGSPVPAVTLTSTFWTTLDALAFDSIGNLWVVAPSNTVGLTGLSPAQLLANNAAIVPNIRLTTGARVSGAAFDVQGNLWTAQNSTNELYRFTASQLTVTGAVTPSARVTSVLNAPRLLAFDANQNLWVTDSGYARVCGFAAADLVTSAIAPRCTLTGAGALASPRSLAFNPASFHA